MPDIVNHIENAETGNPELWITIKDASDLLGVSERHTWRILLQNALKTQKLPNKDRKKTYILRQDVEKYHKQEQERQRLEELKSSSSSDNPDISDKIDKTCLLDKSDSKIKSMSDNKNLPILMSDYKNMLVDFQKKLEQLIAKSTLWKTSAIWLIVLAIVIAGSMSVILYNEKRLMSDNKKEMSMRITDLSGQNMVMSDKISSLTDKVLKAQNEILNTKEVLFQKELLINKLEQLIPKEKDEESMEEKGKPK